MNAAQVVVCLRSGAGGRPSMHHAASRLVIVLQDASITPTVDAMRDINRALHEVTTACEACHAGYRVR